MVEPVVCIFPHSDDEFLTADKLRNFLRDWLSDSENRGRYQLRKLGWKDKDFKNRVTTNSLVLFRKGELVIGEAVVREPIRVLDRPEQGKTERGIPVTYYHGIFFIPASVRVYQQDLLVAGLENWAGRRLYPHYYSILGSLQDYVSTFIEISK